MIHLSNENSLQTSSWLNLKRKMVTLLAEANPVSEEISSKLLLTLNSHGMWRKKRILSIWSFFLFPMSWRRILLLSHLRYFQLLLPRHNLLEKEMNFILYLRNTAHEHDRGILTTGMLLHFVKKNFTSSLALGAGNWIYHMIEAYCPKLSRTYLEGGRMNKILPVLAGMQRRLWCFLPERETDNQA